MGQFTHGLNRLTESQQRRISDFSDLTEQLAGANLLGLLAYGDAVVNPGDDRDEPLQSIWILHQFDLKLLRRLSAEGRRLGHAGIGVPLIVTPAYVQESMDTFPLEFIEIQQTRLPVLGIDPFASLDFHAEHVRLQCERECKVMLVHLRQGILHAAGREHLLSDLSREIIKQLLRTLRGLLWLKGEKTLNNHSDILTKVKPHLGSSMEWISDILSKDAEPDWSGIEVMYDDITHLAGLANAG